MVFEGLKPHTHAERAALTEQLIPLWRQKFGERLLGIAASASYARGEDQAYSDLELEVFVKELRAGEDPYFQRVVDGMLIEAVYHTPQEFLGQRSGIAPHWHLSASDRLVPVYNAPFIEQMARWAQAGLPADADFWRAAAGLRYELQEAFAKTLNAVEQNNVEGVSLLVMDAALHLLRVLALVNRQPFVTFARYIAQARRFALKPEGFDDLLDILAQGTYPDLPRLGQVMRSVFAGVEAIFAAQGLHLYADPLDPNQPNPALAPLALADAARAEQELIRLAAVDRSNWRECARLPTGPDHRHVAPNSYSIAEALFSPGVWSCCIYHQDEMVGYVMYGPDYDDDAGCPILWISRLMIAESQRGRGYGRATLQRIIAEARRQQVPEVGLSTEPDNVKAIGLYEGLGFRPTHMEDDEMIYILRLA